MSMTPTMPPRRRDWTRQRDAQRRRWQQWEQALAATAQPVPGTRLELTPAHAARYHVVRARKVARAAATGPAKAAPISLRALLEARAPRRAWTQAGAIPEEDAP